MPSISNRSGTARDLRELKERFSSVNVGSRENLLPSFRYEKFKNSPES